MIYYIIYSMMNIDIESSISPKKAQKVRILAQMRFAILWINYEFLGLSFTFGTDCKNECIVVCDWIFN